MITYYKNCKIHYTSIGKGPTIVLLHGFLEDLSMWHPFLDDLKKRRNIICIDLLGHGQTECLGYIHTMDEMANAVIAVLEKLNCTKIDCIGHSMGGYVALAMAEKRLNIFKSLCLMNSTFESDTKERQALRVRASAMAKTNLKNLIQLSFSNLFTPESKHKFKREYESALNQAVQITTQAYVAAQHGMRIRPNRFDVFRDLKAKKTIIVSKKDSILNAQLIKNKVAHTDVNLLEFSEGHMSHIENKSELSFFLNTL